MVTHFKFRIILSLLWVIDPLQRFLQKEFWKGVNGRGLIVLDLGKGP